MRKHTHVVLDLNHLASTVNGDLSAVPTSQCFKVARDCDIMSVSEEKKHWKACTGARKAELKSFLEHKVFRIMLRKNDRNYTKPVFIN